MRGSLRSGTRGTAFHLRIAQASEGYCAVCATGVSGSAATYSWLEASAERGDMESHGGARGVSGHMFSCKPAAIPGDRLMVVGDVCCALWYMLALRRSW